MSSDNCIFSRCFELIDLPPLNAYSGTRRGYFLTLTSLDDIPNFILYLNNNGRLYNPEEKKKEMYQNLQVNMDNCFKNNFRNHNFINEENTLNKNDQYGNNLYKKIYCFLLDENLHILSSLSVHFFRQNINDKYYAKIYDVCAAPNQTGTKILMLQTLNRIKPISEFIWLNVLIDNHKAYNLYLDIGFEFVYSTVFFKYENGIRMKDNLQDMIYYEKNQISSRGNVFLQEKRSIILNNMWGIKMFENYISKTGETYDTAIEMEPINFPDDDRKTAIYRYMENVNHFLNPIVEEKSDDIQVEGYERHNAKRRTVQPFITLIKDGRPLFIFINSLVNNTNNFNLVKERYREKLEKILLNFSNISYDDLSILLRTQFPIEMDVQIRYNDMYNPENLKLNLFAVVKDIYIDTYDTLEHFPIPANSNVYDINLNSLDQVNLLDKHIKIALTKGIRKICVRIDKSIPITSNILEILYLKYNLLPSFSASPYKAYTFVYNVHRFNNINNTDWDLDSFNLNNLHMLPNITTSKQIELMQKITGCGLDFPLEQYYGEYVHYLNFTTPSPYKYYYGDSQCIIFSFFGFLLNKCNAKLMEKILERIGFASNLDFYTLTRLTPFLTINFADYDNIETLFLYNMNIFCHTRTVNFISSLSHGYMTDINQNNVLDLDRGQKLIMFTNPNEYFYMSLLNNSFIELIMSETRIQRLFDCIDILSNLSIGLTQEFRNQYRDIIDILINNVSLQTNDVIIYTNKYYETRLLYNNEEVKWVNFPTTLYDTPRYNGTFTIVRNTGGVHIFRLIGPINQNEINSDFSLNGLFINFNSDINTGNNKVISFNFSTREVTCSEPIPADANNVIIGNLTHAIIEPLHFYKQIIESFNLPNRSRTIKYLEEIDNDLSFDVVISKNYEVNNEFMRIKELEIRNVLNTHEFSTISGISDIQTFNRLCAKIVIQKIITNFPAGEPQNTIPLFIRTNNLGEIPGFIMSGNSYVKQYTAQDKTVNLSELISRKLKYNSFVCCRAINNYAGPINKLQGEIRLREILQLRRLIPLNP